MEVAQNEDGDVVFQVELFVMIYFWTNINQRKRLLHFMCEYLIVVILIVDWHQFS